MTKNNSTPRECKTTHIVAALLSPATPPKALEELRHAYVARLASGGGVVRQTAAVLTLLLYALPIADPMRVPGEARKSNPYRDIYSEDPWLTEIQKFNLWGLARAQHRLSSVTVDANSLSKVIKNLEQLSPEEQMLAFESDLRALFFRHTCYGLALSRLLILLLELESMPTSKLKNPVLEFASCKITPPSVLALAALNGPHLGNLPVIEPPPF